MEVLTRFPGAVGNWMFVEPEVGRACDPLSVFNQLFTSIFLEFEEFYAQQVKEYLAAGGNPAFVIMQFNPIKAKFNTLVEQRIITGSLQQEEIRRAVRAAAAHSSEPSSK